MPGADPCCCKTSSPFTRASRRRNRRRVTVTLLPGCKSRAREAVISAWREELQGVEQPTRLPYDRPMQRQGGQSQIGDRYLNLERSEGRALRELAQHYQLTVNTSPKLGSLAAHRYSGESDVVFGVTVAGRPISRPEMQDTVGLFINSIPLRVRMPQAGSVKQWLQAPSSNTTWPCVSMSICRW